MASPSNADGILVRRWFLCFAIFTPLHAATKVRGELSATEAMADGRRRSHGVTV